MRSFFFRLEIADVDFMISSLCGFRGNDSAPASLPQWNFYGLTERFETYSLLDGLVSVWNVVARDGSSRRSLRGHKTRVLCGVPGSYIAVKSLYLLVTTGLTRSGATVPNC